MEGLSPAKSRGKLYEEVLPCPGLKESKLLGLNRPIL
jgi:hypothetical protein